MSPAAGQMRWGRPDGGKDRTQYNAHACRADAGNTKENAMGARPFIDTLRQIRFGELQDELTEELNALTKRCTETGRAGEIVLKIKLKPGKGGQVQLLDDL